jgi:NAD(P)-dependent dehydrogenase (short-subunit alcohol dehydrogenase family)
MDCLRIQPENNRPMNQSSKLYLITGASRGIGFATTQTLATDPDTTILIASRNTARLRELADTVNATTGRSAVHYHSFDLARSDAAELRAWVASFGPPSRLDQ